ncbi:MAG: NUDIX hydrolase [bacterium]|nr:NUDIX hydrolase [bacterium]
MNKERERFSVSVSAAVFIEDEQGRLLLLQQAAGWKEKKWGPPAGGMESHENPIMAALREAREEIGVRTQLTNLIGIYTADRSNNTTGIGFVFRAEITSGQISIRRDEIMDWRFFSPAEIQDLIVNGLIYTPEYTLPAISDWLRRRSYPMEIIRPLSSVRE